MINYKKCKVLSFTNRLQLREWLTKNSQIEKECFVTIKKGKPSKQNVLWYIDCVEEALCFGWIDSIVQKNKKYGLFIRLSPRKKNSHWTMLNIERCKRLIKLKLMTEHGLKTMPKLSYTFKIRPDLKRILNHDKQLAKNFNNFPKLYQRIRLDSIQRYFGIDQEKYKKAKQNFIKKTKQNKMYGDWNDYGRLHD